MRVRFASASTTIIMSDDSTKEEMRALCAKLRAEAEEALAAMDPTRSYVPGSGYTAWENTLAGNYNRFVLREQQKTMATYEDTKPAWMQQNHTMWTPKNKKN